MKLLFVSNSDWLLVKFRLPVLELLKRHDVEVVLVCPRGADTAILESRGFRVIDWQLDRGGMNLIKECKALIALLRIYWREAPDATQHVTIKPNLYGTIAARIKRVPIVINNWDGLGFVFSDSRRARIVRALLLPIMRLIFRTQALWANFANNEIADLFNSLGLARPTRIWRFPPVGVDIDHFVPRRKSNDGPPVVLMASRLLWQKGIGEFVRAARILTHRGVKARFVLCGAIDSANPSTATVNDVDAWQREGVVEILPYQTNMPDMLNKADIVVLPSYHEGLGTILLEAAASGLPLVATDIPGCRLAVEDGLNGILVQPRDHEGLADAIQRLVQDQPLRTRFGQASRNRVIKRFSWEKVLDSYLETYFECGLINKAANGG